jgi:hypothetical protein
MVRSEDRSRRTTPPRIALQRNVSRKKENQKNRTELWGFLRTCVCVRGESCTAAVRIVLAVGASSQVPIYTVLRHDSNVPFSPK